MTISDSFLIKTFTLIDEFSAVTRYSKNRPIKEENNLEHTGWVSLWSYLIAIDIQKKFVVELDFSKILCGAVSHDIDETLTGDIPRPTKYYDDSVRNYIKNIERKSVLKLTEELGQSMSGKNILQDWNTAKGDATVEQYIVKVADLMSVIYKVWHELAILSNFSFLPVAKEITPVICTNIEKEPNSRFPEIDNYFKEHYKVALEILVKCIEMEEDRSELMPANNIRLK